MEVAARFSTWDYVTLATCIALTSIPGFYFGFKKIKNATSLINFLVVNRKINSVTIVLSSLATIISPVGILGVTLEGYRNGVSYLAYSLSVMLTIPVGVLLFIPVYYKLNNSSIYEYLELRFNFITRICASFISIIQVIFTTTVILYAPAITINQVTGLHLWVIVGFTSFISIIYTAIGGFKAVVWMDACQFLVLTTALFTLLFKGISDIGGLGILYDRLKAGERTQFFILSDHPNTSYTFWMLTIATAFTLVGYMVLNQSMMQRYLSNSTVQRAQISYSIISIGLAIVTAVQIVVGLVIYAYYYNCDPLYNKQITTHNQIVAIYTIEILKFVDGLSGIFIGGIVCAAISTVSSYLNSLAIITISDFIMPLKPNITERSLLKLSKLLVIIYGCISSILVVWIKNQTGMVEIFYSVLGITTSPIITLVTTGMLLPWVNFKGAIVGLFASMILPLWSFIGKLMLSGYLPINHAPFSIEGCTNATIDINSTTIFYSKITEKSYLQQFYSIQPQWYSLWSLTVGLIVSLAVSKFTGFEDLKNINSDLFFPFVRNYIIKQNSKSKNISQNQSTADHKRINVLAAESPLLHTTT